MQTSTTIIGLLILALFILPVILISRSGKSKVKRFEKDFFSESSKNNLIISDRAFWNEHAIGIDTANNKIIYLDWSGPETISHIFELKDVKVFKSVPGYEELNRKNFSYSKVERLGLKFSFKDAARQDVDVTFYIAGLGQKIDEQVGLFEKWSNLIRGKIDFKPIDSIRTSA